LFDGLYAQQVQAVPDGLGGLEAQEQARGTGIPFGFEDRAIGVKATKGLGQVI